MRPFIRSPTRIVAIAASAAFASIALSQQTSVTEAMYASLRTRLETLENAIQTNSEASSLKRLSEKAAKVESDLNSIHPAVNPDLKRRARIASDRIRVAQGIQSCVSTFPDSSKEGKQLAKDLTNEVLRVRPQGNANACYGASPGIEQLGTQWAQINQSLKGASTRTLVEQSARAIQENAVLVASRMQEQFATNPKLSADEILATVCPVVGKSPCDKARVNSLATVMREDLARHHVHPQTPQQTLDQLNDKIKRINQTLSGHTQNAKSVYGNYLEAYADEIDETGVLLLQGNIGDWVGSVRPFNKEFHGRIQPHREFHSIPPPQANQLVNGTVQAVTGGVLVSAQKITSRLPSTNDPERNNAYLGELILTYPHIVAQMLVRSPELAQGVCDGLRAASENEAVRNQAKEILKDFSEKTGLAAAIGAAGACGSAAVSALFPPFLPAFPAASALCLATTSASAVATVSELSSYALNSYDSRIQLNRLVERGLSQQASSAAQIKAASEARADLQENVSQLAINGLMSASGLTVLRKVADARGTTVQTLIRNTNLAEGSVDALSNLKRSYPNDFEHFLAALHTMEQPGPTTGEALSTFLEIVKQAPEARRRILMKMTARATRCETR